MKAILLEQRNDIEVLKKDTSAIVEGMQEIRTELKESNSTQKEMKKDVAEIKKDVDVIKLSQQTLLTEVRTTLNEIKCSNARAWQTVGVLFVLVLLFLTLFYFLLKR